MAFLPVNPCPPHQGAHLSVSMRTGAQQGAAALQQLCSSAGKDDAQLVIDIFKLKDVSVFKKKCKSVDMLSVNPSFDLRNI